MAKTIEDLTAEISGIDEKIKKLISKKNALRGQIEEIKNREVLELARQIKAAGKIEEAKRLISEKPTIAADHKSAGLEA